MAALGNAIETYQPAALLYNNQLTEMAQSMINLIPGASELPQYNYHEVTVIEKPECPDREDFTYDDEDNAPYVDEDEFNSAMNNYYKELEVYNLHVESGHYKIALIIDNKEFAPVYFSLEKPRQYKTGGQTVTAKEVQAAIKAGNASPELLEAEIERIKQREQRAEELDADKIQLIVHKQFSEFVAEPANNANLTEADKIGARLIIYQSLDYHAKQQVSSLLFPKKEEIYRQSGEEVYQILKNLTEQQFSYLIRMAIIAKSESKYPKQEAGYFLFQMAKEAGVPVAAIEDEQQQKAADRKERQEGKIKELEKKIKKLKTVLEK